MFVVHLPADLAEKQRVDEALAMRQEKVGLLAVANERTKTERAIDAILKLCYSKVLVCTIDQERSRQQEARQLSPIVTE